MKYVLQVVAVVREQNPRPTAAVQSSSLNAVPTVDPPDEQIPDDDTDSDLPCSATLCIHPQDAVWIRYNVTIV